MSGIIPRTVVITGAASGIGKAVTQALLGDGHNVCVVDVDGAAIQRCRDELEPAERVHFVEADVASEADCERAVAETVERFGGVQVLSRLQLSPAELDSLTAELGQIVDYVEQLGELDTENVEPMAHAVELENVFREDAPRASVPREQILANAPQQDDECYRVPPVLGE